MQARIKESQGGGVWRIHLLKTNSRGEYTLRPMSWPNNPISIPSTHKIPIGPDGRLLSIKMFGQKRTDRGFSLTPRSRRAAFTIIGCGCSYRMNRMWKCSALQASRILKAQSPDLKAAVRRRNHRITRRPTLGQYGYRHLQERSLQVCGLRPDHAVLYAAATTLRPAAETALSGFESFVRKVSPTDYSFNIEMPI